MGAKTETSSSTNLPAAIVAALLAASLTWTLDRGAYALRYPEEIEHMKNFFVSLWQNALFFGILCFVGRFAVRMWNHRARLLALVSSLLSFTLFPLLRIGYLFPPENAWASKTAHFLFVTLAMVLFGSILTLALEHRIAESWPGP